MGHTIETEAHLLKLIGHYESIRLDFKASAFLAQSPEEGRGFQRDADGSAGAGLAPSSE